MRLEHHLVGGYVRYINPHIIIKRKQYTHLAFATTSLFNQYKFGEETSLLFDVSSC